MDAFFYKFLLEEISRAIKGCFIKKVYSPINSVVCFQLSSKNNLFFIFGKKKALFLSEFKVQNPESPASWVMSLRKRLASGKISEVVVDWINRRFCMVVLKEKMHIWVLFDFKEGIRLFESDPISSEIKINKIKWPELESVLSDPEIYRTYPHLTPLLRKELRFRDFKSASVLLNSLKGNRPEGFFLYFSEEGLWVSVWEVWAFRDREDVVCERYTSALKCASRHGWMVLNKLEEENNTGALAIKKEIKKIEDTLLKIEEDKKRLVSFLNMRGVGLLIQQNLYLFDPKKRYESIEIEGKTIKLDPSLTLFENMEKMFKMAKKGERGILILEDRVKELKKRLLELKKDRGVLGVEKNLKKDNPTKNSKIRKPGIKVQVYKTEDGFVVIRGKDQRSNHLLLSHMANPFDIWFHVEDGPGAHVILKRDYPDQHVPQRSIIQAASIAGLFSYQRNSDRAYVMCALVKDVKKIKGAGLGRVKVESVLDNLCVYLDRNMEKALRIEAS